MLTVSVDYHNIGLVAESEAPEQGPRTFFDQVIAAHGVCVWQPRSCGFEMSWMHTVKVEAGFGAVPEATRATAVNAVGVAATGVEVMGEVLGVEAGCLVVVLSVASRGEVLPEAPTGALSVAPTVALPEAPTGALSVAPTVALPEAPTGAPTGALSVAPTVVLSVASRGEVSAVPGTAAAAAAAAAAGWEDASRCPSRPTGLASSCIHGLCNADSSVFLHTQNCPER